MFDHWSRPAATILFLLLACVGVLYGVNRAREMNVTAHVSENVRATATATAKVTRGQESWNYIYIFLGFALAIGGTVISMVPDVFPYNILAFLLFSGVCVYLFLFNGWFQNELIRMKSSYENVGR